MNSVFGCGMLLKLFLHYGHIKHNEGTVRHVKCAVPNQYP